VASVRQSRPDSYGKYKTVKARIIWYMYDSQGQIRMAPIRQSRPDSYGKYNKGKARFMWHLYDSQG
jgi:hypothetical protein